MTRRKSVAQPAPQTIEQAIDLLTRYSTIAAGLAQVEVDRGEAKAKIDAAADKLVVPMELELGEIVKQLKPWWAVASEELTNGKRKSIELAGCLIGERTSTPRLMFVGKALGKANTDQAIAEVEAHGFEWLLRIKKELDKPAILKALIDDQAVKDMGFSSRQREEFFVDAIPPRQLATREVAEDVVGEAA